MERMGSTHLFAHGMHDARGGMASFFIFCGDAQTTGPRQVELAELVVPFLHSAWMRAKLNSGREADKEQAGKPPGETLTVREQEILSWIYLGKSNYEIGTILSISPLTVKNHVQKILRKLNVVNRAQAVGKALDRRIISP
ncbi:MAG TPA: helix-turn-helix transcriptional regulator, partial [Burkholderiales bacterium]